MGAPVWVKVAAGIRNRARLCGAPNLRLSTALDQAGGDACGAANAVASAVMIANQHTDDAIQTFFFARQFAA
ncbi:hypothetical protein [Massilia sp. CCM 8734]|uniref:hypothetical protein n=1 Tax=Massilia sp. CCM 8734 TaxID=2609283 RepID=UPI0014206D3F|nr:hypothetical protein [Massilia sp. CCM 8734]NHZ97836.1 hypothetical protein [Massilia sp. CCM 8734]